MEPQAQHSLVEQRIARTGVEAGAGAGAGAGPVGRQQSSQEQASESSSTEELLGPSRRGGIAQGEQCIGSAEAAAMAEAEAEAEVGEAELSDTGHIPHEGLLALPASVWTLRYAWLSDQRFRS